MTTSAARHRSRPRLTAAVIAALAACALAVAACGSDDSGSPASAADAEGEAVTIVHASGSTTIDGRPERIVTLGLQWTDAVLAMGVQPVGYAIDPMAGDDGRYPWHEELLADSTGLDVVDGLPLEQIAALDPDLILVVPFLLVDDGAFATLSDIAPTISTFSDLQVDPWQDQVEAVGTILGEEDEASEVVDGVEQQLAATAADLPGLAGRTFALANYVPGDSIYVVADPDDGSTSFFRSFGMEIAPDILAVADGVSGRAQLSLEQVAVLNADLLIVFSNDGDPHDMVGYDQLPAVISGAVAEVDYVSVVGLNTPTPLAIPFSLEVVLPALEAAA